MNTYFLLSDVHNVEGTVNLLFPCAQARLDMLPKRLSTERGYSKSCCIQIHKINLSFLYLGIHLDEIIVYETIPSDTLDQELNEYLQNHGVKSNFI